MHFIKRLLGVRDTSKFEYRAFQMTDQLYYAQRRERTWK